MSTLDEKKRLYARTALIVGLGFDVRPRYLALGASTDPVSIDFATIVVEEAYKLGAPFVEVSYTDSRVLREQFLRAPDEYKLNVPSYLTQRAEYLVAGNAATMRFTDNDDLGAYAGVDTKYPTGWRSAIFVAQKSLTKRMMSMLQPWNLTPIPSQRWCEKLGVSTEGLWETLFEITGINGPDPIQFWKDSLQRTKVRCEKLNALQLSDLYFKGDNTLLSVGLSNKARWLGGAKTAEDGTNFVPNWPTFEVYTTPDWRTVRGYVSTTMPFPVGGSVVEDLIVEFKDGVISDVHAKSGEKAYRDLIAHDAGASRAGEIALVSMDSPIARLRRPFWHIMTDENARCHIATGRAYPAALWDGPRMTPDELEALGCNESDTHQDMMISDESTTVFGKLENGSSVILLEKGLWTSEFA